MATQRICSIEGCCKPVKARGLCSAHYQRQARHGYPCAGRAPNSAPLEFLLSIDLSKEIEECVIWPYALTRGGYGQINSNGQKIAPHRFMCERMHGPAPSDGHHAAHSCGNGRGGCVNPFHLEWKTPRENAADKIIHGTHNRGERNYLTKLTEENAREIINAKGSVTAQELCEKFGVSRGAILQIWSGRNWSWLSEQSEKHPS
jgi:hypothetical protein